MATTSKLSGTSRPTSHARDGDGRDDLLLGQPAQLIGLGFRYWMLGRRQADLECWTEAWDLYSGTLGVAAGQIAVGHLAAWVRAIDQSAVRPIKLAPPRCPLFCRDECIAISMIAACQHNTCPAMRACAFALIECSAIDGVVAHAQGLADAFAGVDQVLPAPLATPIAAALPAPRTRMN